jgi:hypothetical protein
MKRYQISLREVAISPETKRLRTTITPLRVVEAKSKPAALDQILPVIRKAAGTDSIYRTGFSIPVLGVGTFVAEELS